MRELKLQKDEMIFECPACGTVVAYTDEDTDIIGMAMRKPENGKVLIKIK